MEKTYIFEYLDENDFRKKERSVRKYNNSTANTLSKIMTSAGFETLDSEWWHFQENSYKNSVANSFKLN